MPSFSERKNTALLLGIVTILSAATYLQDVGRHDRLGEIGSRIEGNYTYRLYASCINSGNFPPISDRMYLAGGSAGGQTYFIETNAPGALRVDRRHGWFYEGLKSLGLHVIDGSVKEQVKITTILKCLPPFLRSR